MTTEEAKRPRGRPRPEATIERDKRILSYLQPDKVHVLIDGRVVESGGPDLAERLEEEGYEAWR